MKVRDGRWWLLGVTAAVSLLGRPSTTHAEAGGDGPTCVAAFEDAQRFRATQRLLAAREALGTCSRSTCPKIIADRCQRWRDAVETAIPTVSVKIVGPGDRPLTSVRVSVDERLVSLPDDGVLTLDPGPHSLRAERARHRPAETRFELKPGEKGKAVSLKLELDPDAPPEASASASASSAPPPPPEPAAIPPGAYVAGGIGVVALGVFAYLGLTAKHRENELSSTCAPFCSPDDVSAVRSKYIGADVALGAGVLSLGIATWLVLSSGGDDKPGVGFGLGPGSATIRGRF